jgi:YbbR domain-containing protein
MRRTRALEELAATNPAVDVDLREGSMEHVKFTPENIDVPPGVRVRLIDPGSLALEWQEIVTRRVPVQSSVTGHVADGHEVARLSVQPEYVELHGPSSLVRVTQLARVAPFDITGLSTGEYKRQLALDPAPDRTQYIDVSSATVTVEIRRRLIAMNFPKLAVDVVGLPGAKTVPAYVDVTVRGTPEVVKGLQEELVVPRVDASEEDQSKHGSKVLTVSVDLSNATAEIQPPTVKVSW